MVNFHYNEHKIFRRRTVSVRASFVDSHCHLNFEIFKDDVEHVIHSAHERGVNTILTICTKTDEMDDILAFTRKHPSLFATVGIHPHEAEETLKNFNSSQLNAWLREYSNDAKVAGIGETGLDFYYTHSPRREQRLVFQVHIETSLEVGLPLSIHTRNAEAETVSMLKDYPEAKGVIHCFTGTQSLADEVLALGYYVSISGIATFKKAEELRNVIKTIPLERLLLETDAPFLAPLPHRGQRNEPALMVHTARLVAEIKEVSVEELAAITTKNFFTLFSKAHRA